MISHKRLVNIEYEEKKIVLLPREKCKLKTSMLLSLVHHERLQHVLIRMKQLVRAPTKSRKWGRLQVSLFMGFKRKITTNKKRMHLYNIHTLKILNYFVSFKFWRLI
jgi:hypothetical protein